MRQLIASPSRHPVRAASFVPPALAVTSPGSCAGNIILKLAGRTAPYNRPYFIGIPIQPTI